MDTDTWKTEVEIGAKGHQKPGEGPGTDCPCDTSEGITLWTP